MSGKSRTERVLGRAMQRKAMSSVFQAVMRVETIVLVHRGRRSGRLYETPLTILAELTERDEIVVGPMWSRDSDWYRNVIAGGLVEIHIRNEKREVEWRRLDEAERRVAGTAFREAHPLYSRVILRVIARLNGLEGDPLTWTAHDLPMLGLRRVGS